MRALVLFSFLLSSSAVAQDLTLVAGHNHFCVLDAEGAKCWGGARRGQAIVGLAGGPCLSQPSSQACKDDDAKVAPRFKTFVNPDRIWAGGESTCVHDMQGLHCFGRVAEPEDAPRLKNPKAVAVGPGHVCAYHESSYKCYGLDGQWLDPNGRDSLVPYGDEPQLMAAGALSTCVSNGSFVQCLMGPPLGGGPRFEDRATALATSIVDVCYLTRTHGCQGTVDGPIALRCRKLHDASVFTTDANFTVCPNQLREPVQLAHGPTHTCILDADGVACIDRRRDLDLFPRMTRLAALGQPSQIAVAENTVCGVVDLDLVCHDLDRGVPKPPPIQATDLAAFSFRLETMPGNLRRLADFVYQDKAKLFNGLATAADRYPLAGGDDAVKARLFILHVVERVIERTDTPFFDRAVKPAFQRRLDLLSDQYDVDALADFRGAAPRQIALEALRIGIETTREYLSQPDHRALYDRALAAVGRAMAQGSTGAAVAGAMPDLQAAEDVFADLSAGSSAPGQALMMMSLVAYLQSGP